MSWYKTTQCFGNATAQLYRQDKQRNRLVPREVVHKTCRESGIPSQIEIKKELLFSSNGSTRVLPLSRVQGGGGSLGCHTDLQA